MNDRFDSITKGAVIIGVGFYITGLLVANLYLRTFGFTDFSLVRTRYILIGIGAVVYLLLVGGFVFLIFNMARLLVRSVRSRKTGRDKNGAIANRRLRVVSPTFGMTALLLGLAYLLAGWEIPDSSDHLYQALLPIPIAGLSFYFLYTMLVGRPTTYAWLVTRTNDIVRKLNGGRNAENAGMVRDLRVLNCVIGPVGIGFVFVGYFSIYSFFFYPILPEHVGGGLPREVQFVVNEDSLPEAEALSLNVDPDTLQTPSYPLIWEGETHYLVGPPGQLQPQQAVQVDKKLIAGVISEIKERPGLLLRSSDELASHSSDAELHSVVSDATPKPRTPILGGRSTPAP